MRGQSKSAPYSAQLYLIIFYFYLNCEFIIFLGQSGSSQEPTSSGDGIPRMSLEQAVMTREERKIKELDDEEYKDYTKL